MTPLDLTQDPEVLFDQDFKAVIKALKAVHGPLTSTLPHVLCIKMFHMDAKVRKAAKEALVAHAPPGLAAHVKSDRRNYASMSDGKKMLKAIKGLESSFDLDAALLARIRVRVAAIDQDLGRLRGGMTDQILLPALTYKDNEDHVFKILAHAQRISLVVKDALPGGLTDALSMQTLSLEGKLKRADHIDELAALPEFRVLDLWVERAQLSLWSALNDKLEVLNLRGAHSALESIAPLSDWTVLKRLDGGGLDISSIAPLAGKPIEHLGIQDTQVQDHEVLLSLTALKSLNVSHNKMKDPSILGQLPGLTDLNASRVAELDLACFENHTSLKTMQLWGQRFDDLSPLRTTSVESVRFTHCAVGDLRPLVDMASLKSVGLSMARTSGDFSIDDLKAARPDLVVYT